MYLKRLELFGFKSFADKTQLVFEPGVTAVVGPNGCGKSNIADGIKWVLGEQSAKALRGSKMEDIIFNGTDNTQAVNLSEVSLVFSNKDRSFPVDYDEVIITRRVFRSGESEYLLNKTLVRLRDIVALLAGTGIGVSSYSIAEQGKMDRILHAKPEDRREIFEEASGITKYKTKKKEALNKLEHTETNLIRLADIVNEVKRQINSIERQAQKAEKFRVEFDKLKSMDIKLAYYEYNNIKDKQQNVQNDNESLKQKEGHHSLQLSLQQDELKIHREKIQALDETLANTRENYSKVLSTIEKNENNIRVNTERIDELSKRSESLTREIEEVRNRSQELKSKVSAVENEFSVINNEKENKLSILTDSESTLNAIVETIKSSQKAISESKVAIMENAQSQSKVKNELNKISASLTTALSRHRRLNLERDKITADLTDVDERVRVASELFQSQKLILDKSIQQLNSLKSVLAQLTDNIKDKGSVIEKLKQRLASTTSKLELLKDLKEKKEGFSEGVKSYMEYIETNDQAKDSFVGIVADMIEATDDLIVPLEATLGEKSQTIVLTTKHAREQALSYLKNNNRGRAQFITLDELNLQDTGSVTQASSDRKRLSDLIRVKDEHRNILDYFLGNIYLVDEIDSSDGTMHSHNIFVTATGDTRSGILVSGGNDLSESYTSIIGRDAKIRELNLDVEHLKAQIADYENEYHRMMVRFEQLKNDLHAAQEDSKQQEIALNAKESQMIKVSEQKESLVKESSLIDLELEEIAEDEKDLKSRDESLALELAQLTDEQYKKEFLISESENTILEKTRQKEDTIVNLTKLRTEASLINEKYESQLTALNMLKGSFENEQRSVSDRQSQLEEAGEKSLLLKQQIDSFSEENVSLSSQKAIVEEDLLKLQQERKSAFTMIEEIENKIRSMQKELDELRNNISNFHLNVNELGYKSSSIKEKIESAYKINLDEEAVLLEGAEDWQSIESDVEQLRAKIDRMGPVNLVAIEEHKELQERYDFLTAQQEDLHRAKESLHKAINKINRTTRQMFIETFDQIKVAFKEYFKLLFGGGTAELFLLDQTDILESGIDIVVRPPGKKLQSISLLSGGEKALTSVALLFALFKVRPTPFCILDEIDAPLDEANIDRFSRMLQEFVKTTQFIIITHNKKTISISDVMYGITMEKSGISKIVSVKLANDDKPEIDRDIPKEIEHTKASDTPKPEKDSTTKRSAVEETT